MFRIDLVITSKTRMQLMEFFLSTPSVEIGIRESARKIGANPMLARNELMTLQKAGLLKSRKVANSIQYSLDDACEAIEPLKKIFGVGR